MRLFPTLKRGLVSFLSILRYTQATRENSRDLTMLMSSVEPTRPSSNLPVEPDFSGPPTQPGAAETGPRDLRPSWRKELSVAESYDVDAVVWGVCVSAVDEAD